MCVAFLVFLVGLVVEVLTFHRLEEGRREEGGACLKTAFLSTVASSHPGPNAMFRMTENPSGACHPSLLGIQGVLHIQNENTTF